MGSFVHLHVHSQYSLLQGAIKIKPLLARVKELGMDACALTDSHNLFGAIDFYKNAKDAGVKPILGCELNLASVQISQDQKFKPQPHHLVVLCKDLKGYQNLSLILTESYVAAKGEKPVVHRDLLERYREGLIVLSGCLRSELAHWVLRGEEKTAKETLQWFQKQWGDDFFIELQDSGVPEQIHVNEIVYQLGKDLGIRSVATNDCNYLDPEDAAAQEILQCIEIGKNVDLDAPNSLVPREYYFKSPEVMRERFSRFPEACDASVEIASRCNLEFKFKDDKGRKIYHLPNFRPENVGPTDPFDVEAYFREQALEGLKKRLEGRPDLNAEEYHTRLKDEVEMILKTGFAGYFLIVADFINWAKNQGIPVGPGRGSGAGSLVAYSLRITDVDPIQFKLLFERFINPERISMPDFDVDFCQDRRGEVIDYVTRKYGSSNVSQIITFGKLQARAVIKDVGRVLGMSFSETDLITKLLPEVLNIKIKDAIDSEPKIRELMESQPKIAKLMDFALRLEGLSRNAGVHAAGVIITQQPIVEYCPLYMGSEGVNVTQFDKDFAEEIGLVKFDFLGLKTLTVIDNAVKLIQKHTPFQIETINYSDKKVFDLVSSGDTDGVFQVESSGMKDLCTRLQPNSVEDLTAINALYRPGPLGSGMVDDFIERKHGRKPIVYEVPQLESILKETYGVILYQEQVMQIARELAGYSLGQADILRRAMGKKKAEEMDKQKELFVKGAVERNLQQATAESIFDLMAKFAEYGFNKSHSAAYAVLTYQTAYLKAYFPSEFMAALMTTEMSNTDKLSKYIIDSRAHKIRVLPPDVNVSIKVFSVEHEQYNPAVGDFSPPIRFGLEAIKGVGGAAVDAIMEARAAKPFQDVVDFCNRLPGRKVNKKVMEALIQSGALDAISTVNRPSLLSSIDGLMEHAVEEQEERELGQSSLFDQFGSDSIKSTTSVSSIFKIEEDWPLSKKLAREKDVVGIYVSGHPMETWQSICTDWLGWNTERVQQSKEPVSQFRVPKKEVQLAGLIGNLKEITTKKGSRMAFCTLEDLHGNIELVIFPEAFELNQEKLKRAQAETEVVVVTGEMEVKPEGKKIFLKSIEFAQEAYGGRAKKVILTLPTAQITVEQLRELKKSLLEFRGKCPLQIRFVDPKFKTEMVPKDLEVAGTAQMAGAINKIFGTKVVQLVQ